MSPILDSIGSVKAYGWGRFASPPGNFDSIATFTVSSSPQTSFDFTSIPSTFTHLQLRYTARNTSENRFVRIRFNNDTTASNYFYHVANGTGSTITAGYENNAMYGPRVNSTTSTDAFGIGIVDILDYRNTSKNTTIRGYGGFDRNGAGDIDFLGGVWMNTSAITSIQLDAVVGNYAQYSQFALYGIKVAT